VIAMMQYKFGYISILLSVIALPSICQSEIRHTQGPLLLQSAETAQEREEEVGASATDEIESLDIRSGKDTTNGEKTNSDEDEEAGSKGPSK